MLNLGLGLSVANGWPNNQVVLPQITTQPISQTIDEYSTATFTVAATGTAPLTYTWRKNGVIVGTNSASYSLTTVSTDSGAVITCTVSNLAGSVVSSNAVLTIQRNFTTFDPVVQTHMTMQTAKVMTDYEVSGLVYLDGINEARLFGNLVDFNSRLFVSPAGSIDFRPAAASSTPLTAYNGSVPLYKLTAVKVRRVGATGYIYVNNVLVSSGAVPTGASNITVIGKNYTSNSGGVLADVVITDLTTPSNSESWKLDRPIGTNTEQSSSGNNLLTYVNATKREEFTKVGNEWLGAEVVVNGGFDNGLNGWNKTSYAPTVEIINGEVRLTGGVHRRISQLINTTLGSKYALSSDLRYVSGSDGVQLKVSETINLDSAFVNGTLFFGNSTAKQEIKFTARDSTYVGPSQSASTGEYYLDNVSVKRILEVA